jgi:hypothetical protein
VLRVGAAGSSTPLAAAGSAPVAAAIFLDELVPAYALAQGAVQSVAVQGVTLTGNDYLLGTLSLSADGSFATFAGVGAPAGASATGNQGAACVGACWPGFTRVLARVAWDGSVAASTTLSAAAFGGVVKGVCAADAGGYYVVGNSSASHVIGYVPHGSSDSFTSLYSECCRRRASRTTSDAQNAQRNRPASPASPPTT